MNGSGKDLAFLLNFHHRFSDSLLFPAKPCIPHGESSAAIWLWTTLVLGIWGKCWDEKYDSGVL